MLCTSSSSPETVELPVNFPRKMASGHKKMLTSVCGKITRTQQETWDKYIQFFCFFNSWECKYIPSQASLWILAGTTLMFLLGKLWEKAVVGCDEWEVREDGEFIPPAQQMTSESQQQSFAHCWVTGHKAEQEISLSLSLPYTYTCRSAHTCAQAYKLLLMRKWQGLHFSKLFFMKKKP